MLTECSAEKKGMHTGTHSWIQGKDKKKKKKEERVLPGTGRRIQQ